MIYITEWQQMLFLACPIMNGRFEYKLIITLTVFHGKAKCSIHLFILFFVAKCAKNVTNAIKKE
jgi:hypothetical protein